jgi:hypothetical protein
MLDRPLVTLVGVCAAGAATVVKHHLFAVAATTGGAKWNVHGVLASELVGVAFILLSLQIYLRMNTDETPKSNVSALTSSFGLAVAVFLLLVGIFSLTSAALTAYMKMGGG